MAIKPVLRMGNPLLLKRAEEITEFNTAELYALIQDMRETMQAEDGMIGGTVYLENNWC